MTTHILPVLLRVTDTGGSSRYFDIHEVRIEEHNGGIDPKTAFSSTKSYGKSAWYRDSREKYGWHFAESEEVPITEVPPEVRDDWEQRHGELPV